MIQPYGCTAASVKCPTATFDVELNPNYEQAGELGLTAPDVDESETNGVDDRIRLYREENGLEQSTPVPVDAVTGSASSLDPHISVANARIQVERVAMTRGMEVDLVIELVEEHIDGRGLGFLGEPGVNVLLLNLALDDLD